ncbi:MAG TPA: hypothetical protein VE573_15435, partial [Nitrososphaeraceae archaeon]|nr:hypothetical protein [Nitrososphaeraceae archaeon]
MILLAYVNYITCKVAAYRSTTASVTLLYTLINIYVGIEVSIGTNEANVLGSISDYGDFDSDVDIDQSIE